MVICLEQGADLHMIQLMPLPLTVFCFSRIQIGFAFLVPTHPSSPRKRAVKQVCVCVCIWTRTPSLALRCNLQISAKYLISFTPNYFVIAKAVVNTELGSSIAEKSAKFFSFCAIWSILQRLANSVPNSACTEFHSPGILIKTQSGTGRILLSCWTTALFYSGMIAFDAFTLFYGSKDAFPINTYDTFLKGRK